MGEGYQKKGSMGMRLIKAASIVFVAAVLAGLVYGYADYWRQFTERSRLKREIAREQLKEDSLVKANRRFVIGAAVGAALGLAYVVRCRMRREDL
jgi:hypothetical protein